MCTGEANIAVPNPAPNPAADTPSATLEQAGRDFPQNGVHGYFVHKSPK